MSNPEALPNFPSPVLSLRWLPRWTIPQAGRQVGGTGRAARGIKGPLLPRGSQFVALPSSTLFSHSLTSLQTITSSPYPYDTTNPDTRHIPHHTPKIQNACHFGSSATSPHGGRPSRWCRHTAAGEFPRFLKPVTVMEMLMMATSGIGAPAGHEPSRRLCRGVQLLLLWRGVRLLLRGPEVGVGMWRLAFQFPRRFSCTSTAVLMIPLALRRLCQRSLLPGTAKSV